MAKPRKVEEPAGTYMVSPKKQHPEAPAPAVRRIDEKTFRKSADKIFKSRRELLRRLAQ